EQRLAGLLADAAQAGHLSSAHDLSDGGLAQALAEACLRNGHGVEVTLPDSHSPFVWLFSESTGRALVSVPSGREEAVAALAAERGVACTALGSVRPANSVLAVEGAFEI